MKEEKKVCKQVGATTPGSSKSSQNLCPSACFCSCLQGNYQLFTIIYGHSSTRVFFFFVKLYIPNGKMVQYSGNFLALVHNKKLLKVDIHIILQRYTLSFLKCDKSPWVNIYTWIVAGPFYQFLFLIFFFFLLFYFWPF